MSDEVDLTALEPWLAALRRDLSPAEMRGLSRRVGKSLRAANAKREKANVTPDGKPMAPRRTRMEHGLRADLERRRGGVRKRLMFQKMAAARWLRVFARDGEAQVGFVGALARIARLHHEGGRDAVSHAPGAPTAAYPARPLLDANRADADAVLQLVYDHLAER